MLIFFKNLYAFISASMISLPLEQRIAPVQTYGDALPSLSDSKEYFEKAYLVAAIEKSVWTKDAEGKPLPHGGIYIDGLAKAMGTSRKNASYLVHQKYNLTPVVDFYRCEQTAKRGKKEEAMPYAVIDKILENMYETYRISVIQDMAKYNDVLPEQKKNDFAHDIALRYVQETIKELPKEAKLAFIANRIIEQNLPLPDAKKEFEKHIIAQEWRASQFSLDETAKKLKLSARHLRRKIQEHCLQPEQIFYFPLAFLVRDNQVTH